MVSVKYIDLEKVTCWFSDKLDQHFDGDYNKMETFLINLFILNVFEVKESILRCFSKLPCSGDLENPGQLPELHRYSRVLSIESYGFQSFLHVLIFPMSRNLFIIVPHGRYVRVTSKIKVNVPVLQKLEGTDGWVLWIFVISSFFTFSRSMYLFLWGCDKKNSLRVYSCE